VVEWRFSNEHYGKAGPLAEEISESNT